MLRWWLARLAAVVSFYVEPIRPVAEIARLGDSVDELITALAIPAGMRWGGQARWLGRRVACYAAYCMPVSSEEIAESSLVVVEIVLVELVEFVGV